jgi:hypothetical protein
VIFDNETRARLIVTVTTDFDPADATVEVEVDDTWWPATWTAEATATNVPARNGVPAYTKWRRPALTAEYFRGPDAGGTGTVLSADPPRHPTKTRVTNGGDVIAYDSTPIDVR